MTSDNFIPVKHINRFIA